MHFQDATSIIFFEVLLNENCSDQAGVFYLKSTMETPDQSVKLVNDVVLLPLLLTLNMFHKVFQLLTLNK